MAVPADDAIASTGGSQVVYAPPMQRAARVSVMLWATAARVRAMWATAALMMMSGLATSGCASTLQMPGDQATGQPHTTIPYTGVRGGAARFEDYSSIDAQILRDDGWRWR
jgi:hypothetical protein